MPLRQNQKYLLASFVASLTAIAAWNYDTPASEHEAEEHEHEEFVALDEQQRKQAGIQVEKARSGYLQNTIHTNGKIVLNENHVAHVIPKISGSVNTVYKNEGDDVNRGEPLVLLESRDMAEAKLAYLNALKKQTIALQRLAIEQDLNDKQMTSAEDFQTALKESVEIKHELKLAQQKLHMLGLDESTIISLEHEDPSQLRFYKLGAPFSGTILNRHATVGEVLSADQEAFVLGNLNELWVEVFLYPQDLSSIKKDTTIRVRSLDGKEGVARIFSVHPVIDQDTHRAKALALLNNPEREWSPGSYLTVEIDTDKQSAPLIVSQGAVQNIENSPCVFVESKDGFEIRQVETGNCDGKVVEILSGLKKGERVASTNTFLLKADHLKNEAEHEH